MAEQNKGAGKTIRFILGIVILLAGITLVLRWWPDVMALVRAVSGMALAVAGLVLMYFAGQK